MDNLTKILDFIQRLLTLTAAFFLGTKVAETKNRDLTAENEELKLKAKEAEIDKAVSDAHESSDSVIDRTIGRRPKS